MGEDQDAAGARGLDEAQRGDCLARRRSRARTRSGGRRRRPRPRRRRRPPPRPPLSDPSRAAPRRAARRPRSRPRRWAAPPAPRGLPLALFAICSSAVSAISVPDRASTWWALRRRAVGQVRLLVGEQPLEAEHQRIGASPLDRGLVAARRRSRRSRPPGRPGGPCPGRAPGPASSPGSTKLSRANSSARERTSPAKGASARAELVSATFGVLVMGKGPGPSWPSGSQRGPARHARRSRESRERQARRSDEDRRRGSITAHGTPKWVCQASDRCAASRSSPSCLLLAACNSDEGSKPASGPDPLRRRRPPRLRGVRREAARQAGRRQQVGVLVRALPSGVPLLPRPGAARARRRRLHRRRLERQRRRRARVPRRQPDAVQALQGPEARDRRRVQRRAGVPDARPSTTPRASWPSPTRAGTSPRTSWRRTSTATLADLWT